MYKCFIKYLLSVSLPFIWTIDSNNLFYRKYISVEPSCMDTDYLECLDISLSWYSVVAMLPDTRQRSDPIDLYVRRHLEESPLSQHEILSRRNLWTSSNHKCFFCWGKAGSYVITLAFGSFRILPTPKTSCNGCRDVEGSKKVSHKIIVIQPSAVIARSNIVRFHINHYRNWERISVICWMKKSKQTPPHTSS